MLDATPELAALIKKLRHACAVALGDLLVLGMPAEASTGKLLQEALSAAGEVARTGDVLKKTGSGWTFEEALAKALRTFEEDGCSGSARVCSHEVELKVPNVDYRIPGEDGRKLWHVVTLEESGQGK